MLMLQRWKAINLNNLIQIFPCVKYVCIMHILSIKVHGLPFRFPYIEKQYIISGSYKMVP